MSAPDEKSLGPIIDSHPAVRPSPDITLQGKHVTIVGATGAHGPDLFAATCANPSDHHPWDFLLHTPIPTETAYRKMLDDYAAEAPTSNTIWYAILDRKTDRALGMCGLMRIDAANRVIEIGGILYSPALRRTPAATEAMFLLARYVFEELGYRRYEWKCNALNEPSRRAAARLGFKFEGIFRQHMILKGRNRDTAWFSMLDGEWPDRKREMERWLDDSNFDENGHQKLKLEEFRRVE